MPGEAEFRAIYQEFRDPLFRFAYRLTGSAAAAEDLVHDCFVGLFRGGFDERKGSLGTYLYAAVRNLARKRFRDHAREDVSGDFEESAADPLDLIVAQETAEGIRQAVESLPMLQREVLILAEYEELPLEEIARIVDADIAAVKSRLHRARERLRKLFTRCNA